MIAVTNRQRWLTCWSASLLLHAGLLLFGVAWLMHPARFAVQAGKVSMEIDLITANAPIRSTQPSATPISSQPIPVIATPASVKTAIKPKPAKPEPRNTPSPSKPVLHPTKASANLSAGAIEAQPDDLINQPPEYPEESRLAREQGIVILRVNVTADGQPANVTILKSSGYFRLDQAARRSVQHWKFHPAIVAGLAVNSETDVPVRFELQ